MVARGMHLFATTTAQQVIKLGKMAAVVDVETLVGKRPDKQSEAQAVAS